MVWASVKSPSLLSDMLLPQRQAAWPRWGRVPRFPRPCIFSCRSCPLPGKDCGFCSDLALSPVESFLGHFSQNRKFFSRTQALQLKWWASRKRTQCFRSSAFTCQARREQVADSESFGCGSTQQIFIEWLATLCHLWGT